MNQVYVIIFTGKEEVLRLHPDLAGHLADEGKLTRDSSREQQSAGLHNLTPEEKAQMNQLNAR
jgi:2-oxo-4-hydroxy-4-carboxy-5-ureidoimidazoline decarboxylase